MVQKLQIITFLGACYGTKGWGFDLLWVHHKPYAWRLSVKMIFQFIPRLRSNKPYAWRLSAKVNIEFLFRIRSNKPNPLAVFFINNLFPRPSVWVP